MPKEDNPLQTALNKLRNGDITGLRENLLSVESKYMQKFKIGFVGDFLTQLITFELIKHTDFSANDYYQLRELLKDEILYGSLPLVNLAASMQTAAQILLDPNNSDQLAWEDLNSKKDAETFIPNDKVLPELPLTSEVKVSKEERIRIITQFLKDHLNSEATIHGFDELQAIHPDSYKEIVSLSIEHWDDQDPPRRIITADDFSAGIKLLSSSHKQQLDNELVKLDAYYLDKINKIIMNRNSNGQLPKYLEARHKHYSDKQAALLICRTELRNHPVINTEVKKAVSTFIIAAEKNAVSIKETGLLNKIKEILTLGLRFYDPFHKSPGQKFADKYKRQFSTDPPEPSAPKPQ